MQFDDYVTTAGERVAFFSKKKLPSRREQTYGWTGYRSSFKKRIIASAACNTTDKNDKVARTIHPRKKRRLLHSLVDKRSRVFHTFTRGLLHARRYCIWELLYRLRRL